VQSAGESGGESRRQRLRPAMDGGPPAVLETFVRGRSVWRVQEPELF
jgi:hypothetical protein